MATTRHAKPDKTRRERQRRYRAAHRVELRAKSSAYREQKEVKFWGSAEALAAWRAKVAELRQLQRKEREFRQLSREARTQAKALGLDW